jgi:branched-chain amino acid transport system substrate-binding protein
VVGARLFFTILLLAFSLAACTEARPAVKIGLIAPFEGLYRRSGYEALAAMRAAIAETPSGPVGVLPLALDDGGDPAQAQRALEKLLASRDVGAIVGPLSPALAAAVGEHQTATAPPILAPFALPGVTSVTAAADADAWAAPLVQTVGGHVAAGGARALVLAGWTAGWPDYAAARWSELAGLPVRLSDDPAAVAAGEAVMWLGAPDTGAAYLAALRARQPDVDFWLGPAGSDPVFAEQTATRERVYWVVWTDDDYNGWAAAHAPSTPSAYLVYRATQEALRKSVGPVNAVLSPLTWRVQAYTLGADGGASLYQPSP